jgi:hypothetical protein
MAPFHCREENMKLRSLVSAAVVAAATVAFVVGSAEISEAKAKKKMAAAPPPAPFAFCYQPHKAVCGEKGGQKFTYVNACYAQKDGAKVMADGACPAKKAMKGKTAKTMAAKKMKKT